MKNGIEAEIAILLEEARKRDLRRGGTEIATDLAGLCLHKVEKDEFGRVRLRRQIPDGEIAVDLLVGAFEFDAPSS